MVKVSGKKRLEQIKDYIENKGKVDNTELSEVWQVTSETVRRDLDKLEEQGVITRIHGGAIWNDNRSKENVRFFERQMKNTLEKRKIAKKAAELLKENSPIFADSSSTVVEAIRALKNERNVLVVTNSSEIFAGLGQASLSMISTGGIFNDKSMSFQGETTKSVYCSYNANLAVISCKGLRIDGGIFDSYESEAEIKRIMIQRAEKVALLADHTKFGNQAFLKLTDLDRLDYIITDCKPSDEWIQCCREHNIELIY